MVVARKSVVAACDISTGDLLNESNLTIKRPGSGLNPMLWDEICGTTATRNYKADEPI
jgi:N,N'-diacetyllegionaminate synthase